MSLSAPVAGLEIGTSRTVIAIGEASEDGRLSVTALGSIPSSGVRKSQIIEMTQARYSIESVLKKLEEQFDYTIGHACLAVSGPQVRTTSMNTQWQLERGFVHEDDIAEINARAEETNLPPERTQLELYPVAYGLDELGSIASPMGMNGNLLKLRSLCIHGATQRINDARAAAEAAKLEILQPCFAGTCAANAVLTPLDKREGTLVIDLGGGSTSYTAWVDGHLVYAGVLGVGGDHVTNDIHTAFAISRDQSEQIKTTAASALVAAEDGGVRVPIPSPMPGFKAASISRRAAGSCAMPASSFSRPSSSSCCPRASSASPSSSSRSASASCFSVSARLSRYSCRASSSSRRPSASFSSASARRRCRRAVPRLFSSALIRPSMCACASSYSSE